MKKLLGIAVLMASMVSVALAGVVRAPEIDASAGVTAVTLLAGGLLVLRSRRRS